LEDDQADGMLLERFVLCHEEAAFTELVRRHGPMVLGVCRRVLRNHDDADDAFQVTFLTLACKARTLRDGKALPNWLYRVAVHTACRARANAERHREREQQAATLPRPDPSLAADCGELGPILDEELCRLPEKCRGPLILCDLEGKTHEEAARALGWPTGSLSKRLARGRELLRQRLVRRGLAPSAGVLTLSLTEPATAAVPVLLAQATVRAALLIATGQTAAGAVSTPAASLLKQTLQAMLLGRLKTTALVVVLVLGLLGAAAGLSSRSAPVNEGHTEALPERTDRFGDPLPPGALARIGTVRLRHGSNVAALVLSGDGKIVVSVGRDGIRLPLLKDNDPTACVWDAATGKEFRRFPLRGFADTSLGYCALSRDGRVLALSEGAQLPFDKRSLPGGLSLPPGELGQVVGERTTPRIRLWDMQTGDELRPLTVPGDRMGLPARFVFAADGKVLASWGSDSAIRFWDVTTGREQCRLAVPPNEVITCLAWSPDCRNLAAAWGNGPIRLWQIPAEQPSQLLRGHREGPFSLAFSPDGKLLASGDLTCVLLWDVAARRELRALPVQGGRVDAVAFSTDGRTVTAVSANGQGRIWNVHTGEELHRFGVARDRSPPDSTHAISVLMATTSYQPLALSADGTTVARLSAPTSIVLDAAAPGKNLLPRDDCSLATIGRSAPVNFAFSPDGKCLACLCADGKLRLWDAATGKELCHFEGQESFAVRLGFSADGGTLISLEAMPADRTGARLPEDTLRRWDVTTGRELPRFRIPRADVSAVSPDGEMLATAAYSQTDSVVVFLWNLTTGKEKHRFQSGAPVITALTFSPDGKTLAVVDGVGSIRLWDTDSGEVCGQLNEKGRDVNNPHVAFSDGKTLLVAWCPIPNGLSGVAAPAQVCEWDLTTGRIRRRFGDIPANWVVLAFSPDGKVVALADEASHTVCVWDLATKKARRKFHGHSGYVLHAAFSPDGKTLASGSMDTTILVWDLTTPRIED
jgi:RNA polymerase sigma factor (sigma-70 family)